MTNGEEWRDGSATAWVCRTTFFPGGLLHLLPGTGEVGAAPRRLMALTILNVAYPLAPVGPDAVGGAAQVLARLDAALVQAGHCSVVIACEGSAVQGELFELPRSTGELDGAARETAWAHCRQAIAAALRRFRVDVVHMHGVDCAEYLPPPGASVLITLHLPPLWYPPALFQVTRPHTFLHCVSSSQRRECPPCDLLLPSIENGVDTDAFHPMFAARGSFAICLGRICPEKGFHLALNAARLAKVPLLLAGQVFGYSAHQAYFREQILPRLDRFRRFIGPVGFERKRRLLSAAACLLIPSLVPETSSLVAMEALACGTPVVAFRSGALPSIVEQGHTGFIVQDETGMTDAISRSRTISGQHCRAAAQSRFSIDRMIQKYFAVYDRLVDVRRGDFSTCEGEWVRSSHEPIRPLKR